MKIKQITKLAVFAFSLAMMQFSVTEAYGQSLNGLKIGSDVRETLRGDRPGTDAPGPIELGEVDILSGDPDFLPDGIPDDPFCDLPDPGANPEDFMPGADMPSDEPVNQSSNPDDFMPGADMPSDEPENQSSNPDDFMPGSDMPDNDPFGQDGGSNNPEDFMPGGGAGAPGR